MDELVRIGKILSDPNRVRIIALLTSRESLCVCEICDTLELSQPLVSRHLKQMREAGIVHTQKSGKWTLYSLTLTPALTCFETKFRQIASTLPQLVACNKKSS